LEVYYLNSGGSWVLAGDGGTLVDLGSGTCAMDVVVDHFTKFAVFQTATTVSSTPVSTAGGVLLINNGRKKAEKIEPCNVDLLSEEEKNVYEEITSEFNVPEDQYVTRGDYIMVMVDTFSNVYDGHLDMESPFTDVQLGNPYSPYVKSAYKYGWIKGYGDGTIRVDNEINRVEALKLVIEAADLDIKTDYKAIFVDVYRDEWYVPYVNYAVANGLMVGDDEGYFHPEGKITLEDLSMMIVKAKSLKTL